MKKVVSILLCLMLLASAVFVLSAAAEEVATSVQEVVWDENEETILLADGAEYGEGATSFTFEAECNHRKAAVTIHTDAATVGEALSELYIIAGDESEWGLYVKTVSGVTADYDEDGSYWAFYIDGEYAMTGVDSTEITEGASYSFKVEGIEEDDTIVLVDGETLGRGETEFAFCAVDGEGNEVAVTVKTDAATVGEALSELYIIAGDESEWGLYVKTVSGVTADYDEDGSYWAFYIDGEYAMTGVDSTEITEGASYTFKVEK